MAPNRYFISFRYEAINTGIKTLKSHQFKVTSWGQTFIKGTVNATKKQTTLMTSIPYELGWHATVDGKKASLHKVSDEFIAINLKPEIMILNCIIVLHF